MTTIGWRVHNLARWRGTPVESKSTSPHHRPTTEPPSTDHRPLTHHPPPTIYHQSMSKCSTCLPSPCASCWRRRGWRRSRAGHCCCGQTQGTAARSEAGSVRPTHPRTTSRARPPATRPTPVLDLAPPILTHKVESTPISTDLFPLPPPYVILFCLRGGYYT